ncbi:hypothetical protein GCM10010215_26580 [Streptomyces virginiae]|uniref:Integral membrane protein n=1 Tax=Streptomyces virginiae TaxID=1961 RepID=A0ABQ3NN22_STRVG|nr:hypothetical protein [Streptomyces virginiae]MBP2341959.1 hypothetical protein [Streptomyces virginiae]GGP99490.1 hypothetical protein GCM10010215_26580 [Streptomyces virginiae]GHI14163.1 hypothetical protein Scinn_36260 [Streptomyces virginiae]
MRWHWIGLAVFTLTLLPTGLAMAVDRVPERLRGRLTPVRPHGWFLLMIYATAPVNALPRLAGASPDVTLACTAVGGAFAVTGCLFLGFATYTRERRQVAAHREGP